MVDLLMKIAQYDIAQINFQWMITTWIQIIMCDYVNKMHLNDYKYKYYI